MKKNKILILTILSMSILNARTVSTTLKDYAYDFSTIGYEISFPASSGYYSSMNAGDYFNAKDDGYTKKSKN